MTATEQVNRLIEKLQVCEAQLETYRYGKKTVLRFRELSRHILHVMAFFRAHQVKTGDRIGIIGTNTLEWVVIDLACIAAGVVTVPLDPASRYELADIRAEFDLRLILSNVDALQTHDRVFRFDDACHGQYIDIGTDIISVRYKPDDELTFKFTSGSTQKPKVIAAMRQSVDAAITFVQSMFQHSTEDKMMVFLPLHIYQQRYWIYSAILFDFDVVVIPKEYVLHSIKADRPTVVMGVPFFYETLMKTFLAEMGTEQALPVGTVRSRFQEYLGGRIRYLWSGSAPLGSDTSAFYEQMQIPLYEGYGMNEVCIVAKNYPGNKKTGSVGKLLPGKHVKFDENNEVLVKSDYPVNNQYYRAAEEDNKATFLEDGFVATGDIGYMDEDGFLFINGRIKELIVLANAIKVQPAPVEKKVEASPLIRHCVVYGDKHPYIVALIVPESFSDSDDDIRREIARINEMLQPHERVCDVLVVRKEFGGGSNRLSAQDKIRRGSIVKEYGMELEKLYK